MIYDKIEEVQKIELEILDEFTRVCKILNVNFFLIGGTALGAVRHSGFIPWDDDIDVGMIRSDYEKFLSLAQETLSEHYFLQTPDSDAGSGFTYAKIRKNGTMFAQWSEQCMDMHKGIYIDLFPFDNIPDDERLRRRQFNRIQWLNKAFAIKQCSLPSKRERGLNDVYHRIRREIAHLLMKVVPRSAIIASLGKHAQAYNKSDTTAVACLLNPEYLVDCMLRDTLYPLSSAKFCEKYYPVPNDIDKYLRAHYGDYMKLPPQSNRINHQPHVLELGQSS